MYDYSHLYINGQWQRPADENSKINVVNPATEQVIATTVDATNDDVDTAVAAAKAAFPAWSITTPAQRKTIILAIADGMQKRIDELTQAISDTMGCPVHVSKEMQVQGAIDAFRDFADLTGYVTETVEIENTIQYKTPIGVCVLINPWNYPLSQLVGKLGPALATGCTVVVKPSEQTPLQDLILAGICQHAGLPAGVFNVITGYGYKIGERLCSHPDVDMVSFTGSTLAGIKVAQAAASTVKRVCQELGGKSPYIITEDAELEAAVVYGVEDVMLNTGQTCNALTRMFVHQSQYRKAVDIAKQTAEKNVVGDPNSIDSTIGPLSSKNQQMRVMKYIQTGIDEGATLVTGGTDLPDALKIGAYVMPTIFADVSHDMVIAREEIFGPVLCIIPFDNEADAIEMANDTVFGLAAAVYAKDAQTAVTLGRQIRAGQCYVQGAYFNTLAPFGGFKQSGNGREWGTEGLKEFIEIQAVFTQ